MRIAAIIYIVASVVANFFVDHFMVFLMAMLSFPVLLWLLLKKKKSKTTRQVLQKEENPQPVSHNVAP